MFDPLADWPVRFSGHETFPLRLLWLKKAYDAVTKHGAGWGTFQEQDAIVRFGVGRNMALAMRHWAIATNVLIAEGEALRPTSLGLSLLDDHGLDSFLEESATVWLLHASLVSTPQAATTFFYAFNLLREQSFTRELLIDTLLRVAVARRARATRETIKRDVEVFLRSYASRRGDAAEDAAEPLFAELGLVRETGLGGQFEFARGPKPSLPDPVFLWSLLHFWRRSHPTAPTLTAEQITYDPGSPGRVFKLDEQSVVRRLSRIETLGSGWVSWTDTAGLGQAVLHAQWDAIDPDALIPVAFAGTRAA